MLSPHDERTITCNTADVLEKVKAAEAEYISIFEEARAGHRTSTIKALEAVLQDALTNGRPYDASKAMLPLPQDRRKDYRTIIKILELHVGPTIELRAADVRQYVMNEWDWMDGFIKTAAAYSQKAAMIAGG